MEVFHFPSFPLEMADVGEQTYAAHVIHRESRRPFFSLGNRDAVVDVDDNLWIVSANQTEFVDPSVNLEAAPRYIVVAGKELHMLDVQGALWSSPVENPKFELSNKYKETAVQIAALGDELLIIDEQGRLLKNYELVPATSLPGDFPPLRQIATCGTQLVAEDINGGLYCCDKSERNFQILKCNAGDPVPTPLRSLARSFNVALLIDSEGQLWSLGSNSHREMGLPDDCDSPKTWVVVPTQGEASFSYLSISFRNEEFIQSAVDTEGQVWAWGDNARFFYKPEGHRAPTMFKVEEHDNVKDFHLGHSMLVSKEGQLWTMTNQQHVVPFVAQSEVIPRGRALPAKNAMTAMPLQ